MTHVLIIGGGGTGGALAHDLTLRGCRVTLVEQGSLISGTSGRHHGLLHSGARYALHDVETARECYLENQILRRLTPQAIEPNDGIFVALDDEDMAHYDTFVRHCKEAGIPVRDINAAKALELEPALSPGIRAAVQVPDATMDAWRMPLHFFATARANGASIQPFTRVERIEKRNGCMTGARVTDLRSGRQRTISADLIVNAAGPWAGKVAALAGLKVPVRPGPGVMVSMNGRRCNMVVNRLHPAGEGDILVPQRNLTIIGTTIWLADDPDEVAVPDGQVDDLIALGARMMPELAEAPVHAVWWANRPLLQEDDMADPMLTSRGFTCVDHQARDGVEGLISLIGGKATTLRIMAEEAANMVCQKIGDTIPCTTASTPLLHYRRIMQRPDDWI